MKGLALLLPVLGLVLNAQSVLPQFEVASIRPSTIGNEGSNREEVQFTSTKVQLKNASISFIAQWAYDVEFYRVTGPDWIKDVRWNILVKTEQPRSEKDLRLRMRSLLAERFHLRLHTEMRPRPVYTLNRGSGKSRIEADSLGDPSQFRVSSGDFIFSSITMAEFAARLSDLATVDRPVVDRTGMSGKFNLRLDPVASALRGGDGPSIFTAVSEIGLQLKPGNEPLEILVIDSADRNPTEN